MPLTLKIDLWMTGFAIIANQTIYPIITIDNMVQKEILLKSENIVIAISKMFTFSHLVPHGYLPCMMWGSEIYKSQIEMWLLLPLCAFELY